VRGTREQVSEILSENLAANKKPSEAVLVGLPDQSPVDIRMHASPDGVLAIDVIEPTDRPAPNRNPRSIPWT
jgi:hypothetical protein